MILSARGAQKRREESKKLSMYSKQWLPGDTLRVYYPLAKIDGNWEIVVGAVWGHSVSDIKGLGLKTAFIPSLTDFDENANPIGAPDITYRFSLIAKAFVDGQKLMEENAAMAKNWPTETARKEALKAIEDKFDTKNNMKAVKPIIGRAQYLITTEVLSVKYANDVPQPDTAAVVSAPLSGQTIDRLYAILAQAKFFDADGDFAFLEIEWKYPVNSDKGKSAKDATPAGLTPEYRMCNQHTTQFNQIKGMLDMISKDSDTIARRATRKIDEKKIKQAITQYSFLNSEYLDAMPEESQENFIKHADLVKELDVVRALTNANLIEKINAELVELSAKEVPEMVPDLTTPEVPTSEAVSTPTVPDLGITPGAPDVQSLLNNDLNLNLDEAALTEVSLELP